ncbi:MAG TPA: RsmE family RNA methyltransferase [Candidatus Hydrogenedentes bacterium]|nr:RsmE family RNA methyltransferase [Candidatus Hydrogenedentota bacterium]HRK36466.1 RsmE family RNA methyltransferase [Candidatus Hydrogenedentota bacterium]
MSHVHRFFVENDAVNEHGATLTGQEAHHALHVVRVRPGDSVLLFNGSGSEWQASVADVSRHAVQLAVSDMRVLPRPKESLTLFQAWLHREKALEELIRHAAELGVARIVFFRSTHSERAPKLSDKWRRTAIEAGKQSGRLWLPHFDVAASLEDAIGMAQGVLLLATRDVQPVPLLDALTSPVVSMFIGPEGDFTESEIARLLEAHAKPISLGDATYRAEVAATIAATLVLYELGLMR